MKIVDYIRRDFFTLARKKITSIRLIDERNLYTLWEQTHLRNLLSHISVDCVFDVGANAGQYATMLRQKVGFKGLIISFEPIPKVAQALREVAKVDPLWVVEELALADNDGVQPFNIMNESQFSSLSQPSPNQATAFIEPNKVSEVISVRTETLTTAYARLKQVHGFRRPFLKLDTQGNDVSIISNAAPVINEFVGIQSELAISKLYQSSVDFREALTFYEQCGFDLSAFVPNNGGHFPKLVETDCIMVRRDLMETKHG